MVFLRTTVGETVSALVIDIFCFQGGPVVEHWDVRQDVPPAAADAYSPVLAPEPPAPIRALGKPARRR